ncbi:hypothetical protein [Nonomuraea guangzhouensis]|uniref:Uncharacterized protein n=1 Tax=Nonomuraea guangzhouensis TaxID=1291555 RepID=A0ABW4GI45_9ACTN|nr:hypothetical protein [Nonomuraea guangzhouensis]
MLDFFKTVGLSASVLPLALAIIVVAAGLTALWAPSAKRQNRAVQVLRIVLRAPDKRTRDRQPPGPETTSNEGSKPEHAP